MMKYVLLFCALLGVFLMSGFESVSGGMKEHKALCTIDLQQAGTQCNFSKADTEQCRKIIYGGEYTDRAIGNVATSISRCNLPSSQLLRFNTSSVIAKIVKSLKVSLPEEKKTSFPSCISLTQYSSRYYIYALRRIII